MSALSNVIAAVVVARVGQSDGRGIGGKGGQEAGMDLLQEEQREEKEEEE